MLNRIAVPQTFCLFLISSTNVCNLFKLFSFQFLGVHCIFYYVHTKFQLILYYKLVSILSSQCLSFSCVLCSLSTLDFRICIA